MLDVIQATYESEFEGIAHYSIKMLPDSYRHHLPGTQVNRQVRTAKQNHFFSLITTTVPNILQSFAKLFGMHYIMWSLQ